MDEQSSNKKKRTVKDISHLFLSALDEKPGSLEPPVVHDVHRVSQLKVMSLIPLGRESMSLLYHIHLAHALKHLPYNIGIISLNPHHDSLLSLGEDLEEFHVPMEHDEETEVRCYCLDQRLSVFIMNERTLEGILTRDVQTAANEIPEGERQPLLFLVDFWNTNFYFRDKMTSYIDSVLFLSTLKGGQLRQAYQIMKAYTLESPHKTYDLIIREAYDGGLEALVEKGFNQITQHFLKTPIKVIGFCDESACTRQRPNESVDTFMGSMFDIQSDFISDVVPGAETAALKNFYYSFMKTSMVRQ